MGRYTISRLLLLPVTLLGLSLVVFTVMRVIPGDVVDAVSGGETTVTPEQREAIRANLGLDDPLPVQYVKWLGNMLRLDFGDSLVTGDPIRPEIVKRIPLTMELALLSLLVATTFGITSGVLSALFQDRPVDYMLRVASLIGLAMPLFWIQSVVRNLILPKYFHWLPPAGYVDIWEDPIKNLQQLWLPALLLGMALSAIMSRLTRSTMLDVLREDYVRTARAKGLAAKTVVIRHALRSALLPVVTLVGIQFGLLMGGTVVTETIFGLPGLGRLLVDGIRGRDYTVVQAGVFVSAMIYLFLNFAVDLINARLDPRVNHG